MSSELINRAESLIARGDARSALDMLGQAARANDPDALAHLAGMSLAGTVVHRDLPLSRDLFRRAAAAGSDYGARAYRAFLANGTGGPRDWGQAVHQLKQAAAKDPQAGRELEIIDDMAIDQEADPVASFNRSQLSDAPEVWAFPSLFSSAECDFLIDLATPRLGPSVVVDPSTGQLVTNPVRTSYATGFPLIDESPAIHALCRRLAAASQTDVRQGEPWQILRYRPGQEYRPHFDAIEGADNQRVLTFLVYLNDDYEGGETRFEASGLLFKGRKGDGLLFRNADDRGNVDPRSQHSGMPVTRGEKFLASRWIRAKPLIPG